jgi:arylsulfatase A-like enzyme
VCPGSFVGRGTSTLGRVSDEPVATVDFFATAMALTGEKEIATAASKQPLDGKNILPFLLGQMTKSPESLYLFFDGPYLQTARAGRWKIHVALEYPAIHCGFRTAEEPAAGEPGTLRHKCGPGREL